MLANFLVPSPSGLVGCRQPSHLVFSLLVIHFHNTTIHTNICTIHNNTHRQDPTSQFRLAIGSYVEQYSNAVHIVKKSPQSDDLGSLYKAGEFDHPYPCTKILWSPDTRNYGTKDLLATTGDYLRVWNVTDDGRGGLSVKKEALLNNNKTSEYCAPLTSFDWNETDPNIVGTSSIDTTCTIWDVSTQQARTQLIAHDREVFDLAFARGKDVFASVGADGSVRMFDLRSLEHSTIIYESPNLDPLLRLEWNKQDPNYLATFMVDSRRTIILDIRVPSLPVAELGGHVGCINATAWAPHSSCHICTAGDDSQALIWDLSAMPKRPVEDPILAVSSHHEHRPRKRDDSSSFPRHFFSHTLPCPRYC